MYLPKPLVDNSELAPLVHASPSIGNTTLIDALTFGEKRRRMVILYKANFHFSIRLEHAFKSICIAQEMIDALQRLNTVCAQHAASFA